MNKIGVLVSGGGTNLQAIIDAVESGHIPDAKISVVISNRRDAYALKRAEKHSIERLCLDRKNHGSSAAYSQAIMRELLAREVDLVCLAGFLLKLEPNIIRHFKEKIMNIHPALLPKFGGDGMYGHHVHEAVLKAGEKESGCTVHFVDEVYDNGPIILQARVPVMEGDTPDMLAKRILEKEHKTFSEAIKLFFENKLEIIEGKVKIRE
jgi:phosphoribosylglycinamide formyltransferase-1